MFQGKILFSWLGQTYTLHWQGYEVARIRNKGLSMENEEVIKKEERKKTRQKPKTQNFAVIFYDHGKRTRYGFMIRPLTYHEIFYG